MNPWSTLLVESENCPALHARQALSAKPYPFTHFVGTQSEAASRPPADVIDALSSPVAASSAQAVHAALLVASENCPALHAPQALPAKPHPFTHCVCTLADAASRPPAARSSPRSTTCARTRAPPAPGPRARRHLCAAGSARILPENPGPTL